MYSTGVVIDELQVVESSTTRVVRRQAARRYSLLLRERFEICRALLQGSDRGHVVVVADAVSDAVAHYLHPLFDARMCHSPFVGERKVAYPAASTQVGDDWRHGALFDDEGG